MKKTSATNLKKTGKHSAMVRTSIWRSMRDDGLIPEARLLYLFLLTNGACTPFGFYHLPLKTIAGFLRGPSTPNSSAEESFDDILSLLAELAPHGLAVYDPKIEWVALPEWFQHNKAAMAKHQGAFRRLYTQVPHTSPIFSTVVRLAEKMSWMPTGIAAARGSHA